MKVQNHFSNVFTYALSVEQWIKNYFKSVDYECQYTFASDFAMIDWTDDIDAVKKTYNNIKKGWLSNYKAFTEIVMCINLLSWANDKLSEQGFEDREKWIEFYSELYYQARDDFYDKYTDNEEACDYFFKCTD